VSPESIVLGQSVAWRCRVRGWRRCRRTSVEQGRRRSTAQALALRSRIVLACAEGGSNTMAQRLGVDRNRRMRAA
jgi:hypothetical protein